MRSACYQRCCFYSKGVMASGICFFLYLLKSLHLCILGLCKMFHFPLSLAAHGSTPVSSHDCTSEGQYLTHVSLSQQRDLGICLGVPWKKKKDFFNCISCMWEPKHFAGELNMNKRHCGMCALLSASGGCLDILKGVESGLLRSV